jgi:hypothetical protein
MNSILTLGISEQQLTQYLDYGFYGIIGFIALGFIIGFIRGIWREGFRFFFVMLLIGGTIFFTREIVDFVVDYDISSLASASGMGSLSLNLGDVPIIIQVTTPFETISNLLEQALLSFNIFITPQLSDLIIGLTLVIIRYLVYIAMALVILLLGETIGALLYFLPFRFVIPRRLRKKVKMRFLGGLVGSVKLTIVLAMFLSPFTSLINTVSDAFKDFDEQYGNQINSEVYDSIMGYVQTYDESSFSTVLFDWYVSEDGKTFDTVLMDFVTGEDLGEYRLTLANELDSFVQIAASVLGSNAFDATFSTIDTSALISEQFITSLFSAITNSTLLMQIIPVAIEIAMNLDVVTSYVDPENIDFDAVNWNEELINIQSILSSVIQSGLVDTILEGETSLELLLPSLFSSTAAPEIINILHAIDDSQFLSQVIPAVLFGLVENELDAGVPSGSVGLSTFLPTEWEDYQSIQFGSELALVYELFYELVTEIDGLMPILLDTLTPANAIDAPLEKRMVGEDPTLFRILRDNFDLLIEIIVGEFDEDGLIINNSPTTGKSINRTSLFDSDLIMSGIPTIVESIVLPTLSSLVGEGFDDAELLSLIEGFNEGTQGDIRLSYKQEITGLFSILNAVIQNDTLFSLLEPEPGAPAFNAIEALNDLELRSDLKENIIPKLDRSELISTIVPGFLESVFADPSFDDFLSLLGITTADLNFDFESLSRELNLVIDLVGYAVGVLDAQSDILNQFPTIYLDLVGMLDAIYASNIINLNPLTLNKTTNYRQIIKAVFSLVEGVGIEEADIDAGIDAVIENGNNWQTVFTDVNNNGVLDSGDVINIGQSGENYHLINFLKTALSSGLLDISGDLFAALNDLAAGSEDLDSDDVSPLYQIFAYADRSNIIASSFGGILDGLFGSTGGLLDDELGSSFRNVESWTEEGSTLVYLVKQLVNFQDGLENLDFLNSDITLVEELLQGLAASQIFIKQDGTYLFPDFLLNQLTGISSLSSYFEDPTPYLISYDTDPTYEFDLITQDFYEVGRTNATKEQWFGTKTLITDNLNQPILDSDGYLQYTFEGGELEYIVAFIGELQTVPIEDLTGGGALDPEMITDVLFTLNEAQSLRVLLFNIYQSIFGTTSLDIGSLSMSQTNTFILLDLDQEDRAVEIQHTVDLLSTIDAMGLAGGGSFDIANFTTETILTVGDLLTTLHDAKLFNTYKTGYSAQDGDLTVFEQAYKFLLTTATLDTFIYDDQLTPTQRDATLTNDLLALTNNYGGSVQDDWNSNEGEIQKFVDIMIAFVETDIDFSSFGGDSISDLLTSEPGLDKVENLLLSMNESVVVSPAIGNLFGNIFESDAFTINGLNMADSNTAYFDLENQSTARATEISLILDIYWDINSIGLTGGSAFTTELIQPALFEGLLTKMHDSKVFNTFKQGSSYANSDLTVFEQTVFMILDTSQLSTYIYEGESSPDTLLKQDIAAIGNNQAETLVITDGWMPADGEIDRIIGILEAFKNTELDFSAFSGAGSNDVLSSLTNTDEGTTKVENLLLAMNASSIVYPAIPNLFSNMLSAGDVGSIGVDFTSANTQYRGLRNNPINPQSGDQYLPYQESEISGLLSIFKTVKDVATKNFSSLDAISNNDLDDMRFLMEDLYQSNIFHQSGASSGDEDDLTVFEQMVVKMMIDTKVADLIYDLNNPNPAYVGSFVSKETKAEFLVLNFGTLYPLNNLTHFTDSWLDDEAKEGELTKFFRVFKELKSALPDAGNLNGLDVGALSPNTISRIMSVMAYSNLASDAVAGLLKDAFDFISFGTYTEGNENYYLTPVAYFENDLNQMNYSTSIPTVSQFGVIPLTLNNFYDDDAQSYLNLGANFNMKTYLDGGNSTYAILDLLDRSSIFGNTAESILNPSSAFSGVQDVSHVFKTRSLTFYNLLNGAGVTKYFDYLTTSQSDKELKIKRIEAIFAGDFDVTFEAERLDDFISTISAFTALEDASTLDENAEEMKSLITVTYQATGSTITDRAFMVSELSAGFFTDIFNGEYALVNDTFAPYFGDASNLALRLNFYDRANNGGTNDFENLNPKEAEGLEGALNYLNVIKAIASGSGTPTSTQVTQMKAALTQMGSKVNAGLTTSNVYPNYLVADYVDWNGEGLSSIAKLFYASRIANNAGFTTLNNNILTLTSLPLSGKVATSLSTQPYADNFVFEIEGEKFEYVYA